MTASSELHGDQLIATRHLDASPQRVWDAFVTPSQIAAFWGGSHATVPAESVTVQLRPGGEFSLDTKGPDGSCRRLEFVYRAIRAPQELVFDEATTGLRTTITIRSAGGGTDLTIHQRQLPPELQTTQAANGLASILDALALYLTSERADQ